MCLITSAPPEDPVVRKKVVYSDAPRRSTSVYDPYAPRRSYPGSAVGYPSTVSPRSSVTRTVYTEPLRDGHRGGRERSYANGSYGDIDRVDTRIERRSYAGSYTGSSRDVDYIAPGEREMVGRVYVERPRGSSQASVVIVDETESRGARRYAY